MARLIKVWATEEQFEQLKGKFKPHEVVTLLMLRKLGVEWKDQREALDLQELKTRREIGTKSKRTEMRARAAVRNMGPMTIAELGAYLEISKTQTNRLVHKELERVGTKNGAYLWGLKDN